MKTFKIAAFACFLFLVVPIFANTRKPLPLGKVTNARTTNKAATVNKTEGKPETIKIMTPIKHRVKKGENFYRIAKRYGVTVDKIRSREFNPNLANRKNKNLLLRGEVINIPVYRVENRPVPDSDSGRVVFYGGEFLAMTPEDANILKARASVWEEREKKIEGLQYSADAARKWAAYYTLAIGALLVLAILLGWNLIRVIHERQALKS